MGNYSEIALVRGLSYLAEAQAAIAHNLANVDTRNFKRRAFGATVSNRTFESELRMKMPTIDYREVTDWRPGTSRETGNRFNVSLDGPYFFRVQTNDGRMLYTRDGEMRLDEKGRLVTREGHRYLDANNLEISLFDGEGGVPSDVAIAPDGSIGDASGSGQSWGPLGVWELPDRKYLQPVGDALYDDVAGQTAKPAAGNPVQQGFLEGSNIDSLQEMVQMILIQRTFTATQRTLTGVGRMQESLIQHMSR